MRFQPSFLILSVGKDLITFCKVLEFSYCKNPFKNLKRKQKQTYKNLNTKQTKKPNTLCTTYHKCVHIATGRLYRYEPVNNRSGLFVQCFMIALVIWIALAFRIRSNMIQTFLCGRISKIKTNTAPYVCCLNGSSSRGYLEQHQFS